MIKYIREHKEFVTLAFLQLSTIVIDHSYLVAMLYLVQLTSTKQWLN